MQKRLILLALVAVLVFSLSACMGGEASTNLDPKATQKDAADGGNEKEEVNLSVWLMPNSADTVSDFLDITKPYTDQNPHVKINATVIDWGAAWTRLTSAATTGSAPDISQLGSTWVAGIGSMGALVDLSDKIDGDKFVDATKQFTGIRGRSEMYGMPWFTETRALFYRIDACEKAGVDPKTDFDTWDSFKNSLQKLNNIQIDGKKLPALGMPGKNDWNVIHNFSFWIYGAGGEFVSSDGLKATFSDDKSLEGINFYVELAVEGLMDHTSLENDTNHIESMYAAGEYCTSFMGPWVITVLKRNKADDGNDIIDKTGIGLVPEGPEGRFAFAGGSVLSVFNSSKNIGEAVALLDYLSGLDAQLAYSEVTGNLPTTVEAYDDPAISGDPYKSIFKEQMKYGKHYASIPGWAPAESIFQSGLSIVWDNAMGIGDVYSRERTKAIIEDVEEELNQLLEENAVELIE